MARVGGCRVRADVAMGSRAVEPPRQPGMYADRHGTGAARRRFAARSVSDGVIQAEWKTRCTTSASS
jgi:hypothetical protein